MTGRLRAALALLLYVGFGLGTPLADGLIGHRNAPERAHHVEAAGDTGCHAAECILDAPGAPQAPARSPVQPPVSPAPVVATRQAPPTSEFHRTTVAGPLGPRAPPLSD